MAASWHPIGTLTKSIKEGTSKAGKPWMLRSISKYKGKDKETGESIFEYISFFVKPQDIDVFRDLPHKTKIRLHGEAEASAYINKEGEAVGNLQLNPAWEEWYEILAEEEPEPTHSEEPF